MTGPWTDSVAAAQRRRRPRRRRHRSSPSRSSGGAGSGRLAFAAAGGAGDRPASPIGTAARTSWGAGEGWQLLRRPARGRDRGRRSSSRCATSGAPPAARLPLVHAHSLDQCRALVRRLGASSLVTFLLVLLLAELFQPDRDRPAAATLIDKELVRLDARRRRVRRGRRPAPRPRPGRSGLLQRVVTAVLSVLAPVLAARPRPVRPRLALHRPRAALGPDPGDHSDPARLHRSARSSSPMP